jgi:hypothetical protein
VSGQAPTAESVTALLKAIEGDGLVSVDEVEQVCREWLAMKDKQQRAERAALDGWKDSVGPPGMMGDTIKGLREDLVRLEKARVSWAKEVVAQRDVVAALEEALVEIRDCPNGPEDGFCYSCREVASEALAAVVSGTEETDD